MFNKISNLILVLILINLSCIVYSQKGFKGIDFSKVPKKEDVNTINDNLAYILTMRLQTRSNYIAYVGGSWRLRFKKNHSFFKTSTSPRFVSSIKRQNNKPYRAKIKKFIEDNIESVKKVTKEAINFYGTKRRIFIGYNKKSKKFYFSKDAKYNQKICTKTYNYTGQKLRKVSRGEFKIKYETVDKKYTTYEKYSKDPYCRFDSQIAYTSYNSIADLESVRNYKTNGLKELVASLKFPECKSKHLYLQTTLLKTFVGLGRMGGQEEPIKLAHFFPSVIEKGSNNLNLKCHN